MIGKARYRLAGLLGLVAVLSFEPVSASTLRSTFETARAARDWAAADALVGRIVEGGDIATVAEYLVYDRGRCAEALELLGPARSAFDASVGSDEHFVLTSALACEAARLENVDPNASKVFLAEAIDKDMSANSYAYQPKIYEHFAREGVLNEVTMRFLARNALDNDVNGYAMQWQISQGRVENVRKLLQLGANPNELHGVQHSALGATLELLSRQPDVALQITSILLSAGADPAMLMDFGPILQPDKSGQPISRARREFDALLAAATTRLAESMPVRIEFCDTESTGSRVPEPEYARFYAVNRSGRDIVLDIWRDSDGFDFAGDKASIEFRVAPGTKWLPYDYGNELQTKPRGAKRVLFEDGDRILLRVRVVLNPLLKGPPGLQLRLRLPSAEGRDFLSTPFALHDSRYVRGAWPRDASYKPIHVERGDKLSLPDGLPKGGVGHVIAPHAQPSTLP